MQNIKNVIITGCNKGIGNAILQKLAAKEGWNIIMACRNLELAQKAKTQIKNKIPSASLNIEQLQVGDEESTNNFVKVVEEKYKKIDVLINNAGVLLRNGFGVDQTKLTLKINFFGTVSLTQKLLNSIADNGKIIFVGSGRGKLQSIKSQEIKNRFKNPNLEKKELFDLMDDFVEGVKDNNCEQRGWQKQMHFKSMYGISKLGINLYPKILSNYKQIQQRNIQTYSCCPGFVDSDLSNHEGVLTIEEGSRTPVFLAELPFEINKQYQGQFFQKQALSTLY